jgi:hypothetical protein
MPIQTQVNKGIPVHPGIVDSANSGVEQMRSESGKLSQMFEVDTNLYEIIVNNRTMMEVLYSASAFVEVPEAGLL